MEGKHRGVGMERLTAFPEHYELRQLVKDETMVIIFVSQTVFQLFQLPDMPIYRSQVPRIFHA